MGQSLLLVGLFSSMSNRDTHPARRYPWQLVDTPPQLPLDRDPRRESVFVIMRPGAPNLTSAPATLATGTLAISPTPGLRMN